MSAFDRWSHFLQERDAICAAILDVASAVEATSVTDQSVQFEFDLDDQAVCDARARLAILIEDPALADVITHALRRLSRRWEERHPAVNATTASPQVFRSLVARLRRCLSHALSKDQIRAVHT